MKKILISISRNTLVFSYSHTSGVAPKSLLNTNVISNDELIFSDEYLEKNIKIVRSFLNELTKEKETKKIVIVEKELTFLVLPLLQKVDMIEEIFFQEDFTLTYSICEKLTQIKSLKVVNCYNIPMFLIEFLDRYGISAEGRAEILFTSRFMAANQLSQYSKIYYKSAIRFTIPITDNDLLDFDAFCKINRYLRTIHIDGFQAKDLNALLQILDDNRTKNIKILIHGDIANASLASYLKRMNKKYKKRRISIKISYSDEYLKDNIFGQIILNTLKVCGMIGIFIIVTIMSYITYNNYQSAKNAKEIHEDIAKVIENIPTHPAEEPNSTNPAENSISPKMEALLTMNDETVGWLTVNNTNINYPVVQAEDNKFYLKHDYYKQKEYSGWIFMDYRNHKDVLDKNTIIYGHNAYSNAIMFGGLPNMLRSSWLNNEENLTIAFDSLNKQMRWKIFSIYRIKKTSDYIQTTFESDYEYAKFLDMITERSYHDFGIQVTKDDKILTLSTCASDDRRLVVHAVLVQEI